MISQPVFIDPKLQVFDEFDTGNGEHELDVVGLFRQSKPRIVFELSDMTYVPLEGIAFICEVKSQIDKQKLEHDLKKLAKLEKLCDFEREMRSGMGSERYAITPPVKCLIYDQHKISTDTFEDSLEKYPDVWDLILIVENDTLVINSNLPIIDAVLHPNTIARLLGAEYEDLPEDVAQSMEELSEDIIDSKKQVGYIYMTNPLINFLTILSLLIPSPIMIYTTNTLEELTREYVSSMNEI